MRPRLPTAALAVAALYALLLQAFIGALAPTGPLAAAIHCAPAGTNAPADAPAAHDGTCCLLACRPLLAPPPAAAAPAPRAARRVAAALPVPDAEAGPAPAGTARARGPPVV